MLRATSRPVRRRLAAGAAVLVALLAAPLVWVQATGQPRVHPVADVPPRPVGLVLGAGIRPDGTPSTFLRRRLEAARDLYAAGTVRVLLVSGDNRTRGHDEPTVMRDWLVAHGVPAGAVVRDFAGIDTHDSCVRAHEIFGVDSALVVTQDYHVRRALFLCAHAGIDAVGVGVSSSSVEPARSVLYRVREAAASYKAALDVVTGRPPHHLGPAEPDVADALATG